MLLSWQEPLFISKTSYIYFRHDVNITQQDRESSQWFSVSWDLEKSEIVWIKWPWLFGQHPHSRHCLPSPAWGSRVWNGCMEGKRAPWEKPDCTTGSLYCRKPAMCHAQLAGCRRRAAQGCFPCQHKALPKDNRNCSYPGMPSYASVFFKAGCSPTGSTGVQSHEGQRRAKPSTTPQLPQDKRGASQGWQHSAGAFWGCGGGHKMMPACRSTTDST